MAPRGSTSPGLQFPKEYLIPPVCCELLGQRPVCFLKSVSSLVPRAVLGTRQVPGRSGGTRMSMACLWRQVVHLEAWGGSKRDSDFLGCGAFLSKALPLSEAG